MSRIFVNPGTKTDGCYYHDVILMQQMLPSIRSVVRAGPDFRPDLVLEDNYEVKFLLRATGNKQCKQE